MSPFPLAVMMAEQVIAYVLHGLEMRDARVLLLAVVFLLVCLPIAAAIDLALLPAKITAQCSRAAPAELTARRTPTRYDRDQR
jgi:hypothetical protein